MATRDSRDHRTKGSCVSVLNSSQIDWNELFKEDDDPGDTLNEIADHTGKNIRTMAARVARKVREGTLIKGRAMREDSAGRRVLTNVYRPAK